jgi:hypothetical protein
VAMVTHVPVMARAVLAVGCAIGYWRLHDRHRESHSAQ